jgi:hypothetical protein
MPNNKILEFIHIPKTGGSVIEETYREMCFGRFAKIKTQKRFYYNNSLVNFWHKCDPLPKLYKNSKLFCVIRNPIDRFISQIKYEYFINKKYRKPLVNILSEESLNKYIDKVFKIIESNKHYKDNHYILQINYANQCDYIILYENLEIELKSLFLKYNISYKPLLKSNVSNDYEYINKKYISPILAHGSDHLP